MEEDEVPWVTIPYSSQEFVSGRRLSQDVSPVPGSSRKFGWYITEFSVITSLLAVTVPVLGFSARLDVGVLAVEVEESLVSASDSVPIPKACVKVGDSVLVEFSGENKVVRLRLKRGREELVEGVEVRSIVRAIGVREGDEFALDPPVGSGSGVVRSITMGRG